MERKLTEFQKKLGLVPFEPLGKNYAVITHKTLDEGRPLQDDVLYILVTTMDKAKEYADIINSKDNIYFSPTLEDKVEHLAEWYKRFRDGKDCVPAGLIFCKVVDEEEVV